MNIQRIKSSARELAVLACVCIPVGTVWGLADRAADNCENASKYKDFARMHLPSDEFALVEKSIEGEHGAKNVFSADKVSLWQEQAYQLPAKICQNVADACSKVTNSGIDCETIFTACKDNVKSPRIKF